MRDLAWPRLKRFALNATALLALLSSSTIASAASLFVQIPGITGEQSTPGYPGAMSVRSLVIQPHQFIITKALDSASAAILAAVNNGTVFPSASALLYNSAPVSSPDATLVFQNVVGNSYQILGGGTSEEDGFAAATPGSMFLELPGIVGASSTPGHPAVMQIDSFSLTANQFSIVKLVDSASPSIMSAVTNGTHFATASVLFYNAAVPSGPPDGIFTFGNVVANAYQILNGGDLPHEQDTFNFAAVVPEPATTTLLVCFALFSVAGRRGWNT